MVYGTSHFLSRGAAIRYYADYGYDDTGAEVDRKIADGEIHIGAPSVPRGATLILMDHGRRYGIREAA